MNESSLGLSSPRDKNNFFLKAMKNGHATKEKVYDSHQALDLDELPSFTTSSQTSLDSDPERMMAAQTEIKLLAEAYNNLYVLRSEGFKPLSVEPQEHTFPSGHLVYETPLHNAPVIYDDIGDLLKAPPPLEARQSLLNCPEDNKVTRSSDSEGAVTMKDSSTNSSRLRSKGELPNCDKPSSAFEPYTREKYKQRRARKVRSYPSAFEDESDSEFYQWDQGIAKIIGTLPIAEYEGSPRRYGPISISIRDKIESSQSEPHLSKRFSPGLLAAPNSRSYRRTCKSKKQNAKQHDISIQTDIKGPTLPKPKKPPTLGNSYVGTRLAHAYHSKRLEAGKLESSTEVQAESSSSTSPSTGLVAETTQQLTISPATTDAENNEEEAIISHVSAMPHPGRLRPSMPVLEDGLSSGQDSEDPEPVSVDDNPTLLLINKQISEIEQKMTKKVPQETVSTPSRPTPDRVSLEDLDLRDFDSLAPKEEVYIEESSSQAVDPSQSPQFPLSPESPSCQQQRLPEVISPVWIPRQEEDYLPPEEDGQEEDDRIAPLEEFPLEDGDHYDDDAMPPQETDKLLKDKPADITPPSPKTPSKKSPAKEVDPGLLVEGVLFRACYLGSTHLVYEPRPSRDTRMLQAEEAVTRIKAPEGETQPSTQVDLFISTEKVVVLNTDLKEVIMDHPLPTISYIADIGDLVVLMAKRVSPSSELVGKILCHVFESEDAQFIAQSIGQAFQVAYLEFLKAHGLEAGPDTVPGDLDYQEVLNSQEILGNELEMFSKKEKQKEVVVRKKKGEILGLVIMESGWGSMVPTVVVANMAPGSPASRSAQLNIGDQIISVDDISLVGLPISTCQAHIKNTKHQTVVRMSVVPCAPVVEVRIKRPDTKYQLGFSVQNGVICSLLRGGIAERGGVRVGHRIIEINGESVVAVPHDRIVAMLATSVGEIQMKTMPTSMFRLLTGQETPLYI